MKKMTPFNKLALCIAFSVASLQGVAAPAKADTTQNHPLNLAQNVSNVIYHSSQIPVVLYNHQDIIGKLLRGDVVNPNNGVFGALFSGATSLLNGDFGKLINLSKDLGTHIKAIQQNGSEIKTAVQNGLPSALTNVIYNAPQQIANTVNSGIDYLADKTVERSRHYQELKETLEDNNKKLAQNTQELNKNKAAFDKEKKALDELKKQTQKLQTELSDVKKEKNSIKEALEELKNTQKTEVAENTGSTTESSTTQSASTPQPASAPTNSQEEKAETASVNASTPSTTVTSQPQREAKGEVDAQANTTAQTSHTAVGITMMQAQTAAILHTAQAMDQHAVAINKVQHDVAKLQQQYQHIQHTVQENRKLSSQGIASIAAMSNIPVPAVVGKTTIGAGVGHFDAQSAIAVGVARYYDNGTAVKLSVGTSGSKVAVGGGVSYSF